MHELADKCARVSGALLVLVREPIENDNMLSRVLVRAVGVYGCSTSELPSFLHAAPPKRPRELVWPPDDQARPQGYLRLREKAVCGLRVSPKAWQEHLAEVLLRRSYKRRHYAACVFLLRQR